MSDADITRSDHGVIVEPTAYPAQAHVDEVIAEFDGDRRAAIAALLSDLATLAGDFEGTVSRGFTRCAAVNLPRARRCKAT